MPKQITGYKKKANTKDKTIKADMLLRALIICYNCKMLRHIARKCPKLKTS